MRRGPSWKRAGAKAKTALLHSAKLRGNLRHLVLTSPTARPYKPSTTARRPAFRRDGAPAKLLTDKVTSRPVSVGRLGLRRLPGAPGRGTAMVPGLFDK